MKFALIIFLAGVTIFLGFSVFFLRKELLNERGRIAFLEEGNDSLQKKLMHLNRAHSEKERFLNEIEQGIRELESKVPLETLERYTPKKTWDEIKPIIDKLQAFLEVREKNILPSEESN
jgi:Tfp pilus assembly protein PilN